MQIGQTYTLSGQIKTGSAPGQSQYTLGSGQQVKILNSKTVNGQLFYDVQHIGGGTGWTNASSLTGATSGTINANQIKTPTSAPTTSSSSSAVSGLQKQVETYKKQLEKQIAEQQRANQQKLTEARATETQAMGSIQGIAGEIRTGVEGAFEKMQPGIMEDFNERRNLVNRLETLLTEGQSYIEQQKNITGLASVRNPRINRAIEDVAAEASIIQSVISARDGNIQQAFNIVGNEINVIMSSRQEELNYYRTVLDLANRDIISLDSESKELARTSIASTEKFLNEAMDISSYVKQLLINPATAGLMDGIKLTDSIEQIQAKVSDNSYKQDLNKQISQFNSQGYTAVYDPSSVPASQLASYTDTRGVQHYFRMPPKETESSDSFNTLVDILKRYGVDDVKTGFEATPPALTGPFKDGQVIQDPVTGIVWKSVAGVLTIY